MIITKWPVTVSYPPMLSGARNNGVENWKRCINFLIFDPVSHGPTQHNIFKERRNYCRRQYIGSGLFFFCFLFFSASPLWPCSRLLFTHNKRLPAPVLFISGEPLFSPSKTVGTAASAEFFFWLYFCVCIDNSGTCWPEKYRFTIGPRLFPPIHPWLDISGSFFYAIVSTVFGRFSVCRPFRRPSSRRSQHIEKKKKEKYNQ